MACSNWYIKSASIPGFFRNMFRSRKDRILALLQEYPNIIKNRGETLRHILDELSKKPVHPDIILWVLDPKNRADATFREEVMRHPNVPVECLHWAITDPDPKIANMAAEHRNADNRVFEMLAGEMLRPDRVTFDGTMINKARIVYAFRNPVAPDWFRYIVLQNISKFGFPADTVLLLHEYGYLKFGPNAVDKFTLEQRRSFIKEYRDKKHIVNQYVKDGGELLAMAVIKARLREVRILTRPLAPTRKRD